MCENRLNTRAQSNSNSVSGRAPISHNVSHCVKESDWQIKRLTIIMRSFVAFCTFCCLFGFTLMATTPVKDPMELEWNKLKTLLPMPIDPLKLNSVNQTWCTCGVFLTGQFKKGEQPKGYPALMHEQDMQFACSPIGTKQCSNKCLETVSFIQKQKPNR